MSNAWLQLFPSARARPEINELKASKPLLYSSLLTSPWPAIVRGSWQGVGNDRMPTSDLKP